MPNWNVKPPLQGGWGNYNQIESKFPFFFVYPRLIYSVMKRRTGSSSNKDTGRGKGSF